MIKFTQRHSDTLNVNNNASRTVSVIVNIPPMNVIVTCYSQYTTDECHRHSSYNENTTGCPRLEARYGLLLQYCICETVVCIIGFAARNL